MIGPRAEMVDGRRTVRVEWGLRKVRDGVTSRAGHISETDSLEFALACRDRPFAGWHGDEQVVTRTVVTYTTSWKEVPGHEGSLHMSCDHPGTPQGRTGPSVFPGDPDCPVRMEGPDYQRPHAYRERDMTEGGDGHRRYTCPVCGLTWRQPRPAPRTHPTLF